jgi:O-antigen ligase
MLAFVFILAYLVLVLVRPQEYPQWANAGIPALQIALIAALLSWLFSRHKRFDAPQYPLLLMFLLATCISVALNGWTGGAFEQFKLFAPILVAFVLLANATTTSTRIVLVIAVFTLCAALLALHGVGQSTNGVGWTGTPLVEDSRIQYIGIFSDPNDLGMLFVLCLPMAICLGSGGALISLRRIFWMSISGLLLYGIYLTDSRGAMLALIAMIGAYLWLRRGPVTAAALAMGCLLALQLLPSRLHELDAQESSALGRIEAWYDGFQMFLGSPLYGVGTGRFTEHHPITAHNSLVLVLAENGFLGFVLWFAFIGYCFWMMLRIVRHVSGQEAAAGLAEWTEPSAIDPDEEDFAELSVQWRNDQRIARALLLSLVGYASTAFFLSRAYIILLYLLAALVVAHFTSVRARFPEVEPFKLARDLPRWVLLAGLATTAFYLILKILLART